MTLPPVFATTGQASCLPRPAGPCVMREPVKATARRPLSLMRDFLRSEAAGGLILMAAAALRAHRRQFAARARPISPRCTTYLGPLNVCALDQ